MATSAAIITITTISSVSVKPQRIGGQGERTTRPEIRGSCRRGILYRGLRFEEAIKRILEMRFWRAERLKHADFQSFPAFRRSLTYPFDDSVATLLGSFFAFVWLHFRGNHGQTQPQSQKSQSWQTPCQQPWAQDQEQEDQDSLIWLSVDVSRWIGPGSIFR